MNILYYELLVIVFDPFNLQYLDPGEQNIISPPTSARYITRFYCVIDVLTCTRLYQQCNIWNLWFDSASHQIWKEASYTIRVSYYHYLITLFYDCMSYSLGGAIAVQVFLSVLATLKDEPANTIGKLRCITIGSLLTKDAHLPDLPSHIFVCPSLPFLLWFSCT